MVSRASDRNISESFAKRSDRATVRAQPDRPIASAGADAMREPSIYVGLRPELGEICAMRERDNFDAHAVYHLHLVVDGELRQQLEDYARAHSDRVAGLPNVSSAARELLRIALELPRPVVT